MPQLPLCGHTSHNAPVVTPLPSLRPTPAVLGDPFPPSSHLFWQHLRSLPKRGVSPPSHLGVANVHVTQPKGRLGPENQRRPVIRPPVLEYGGVEGSEYLKVRTVVERKAHVVFVNVPLV
eukprot:CAMPEP_0114116776 /NCGR_PEP_ID=MMETSP0043_2-20121206/4676_1 /TAXON_ID=464988 /ORGANISM="Hemiselmis andersenii, Strain CCMP644" /LENGTH=119 /DNA_ID=CAMNT_0001209115 /DNA_START=58 /DNA_END=417 /DNA_ORIENTATION=-